MGGEFAVRKHPGQMPTALARRIQFAKLKWFGSVAFLVMGGTASAQGAIDGALLSAARGAVPAEFSDSDLEDMLEAGLQNPDGTALAVVIPRAEASLVLVFLWRSDGNVQAVDASRVESANFGYFGRPRTDYERYETQPIEWRQRDDGRFQVVIQTRAWRMDQRHTAAEALLIDADGTVLYR